MKYGKFFCKVYETCGWNYYSETFGELLVKWLTKQHISIKKALDLGCGTGVLCKILADAKIEDSKIEVQGVDLSESMIEIARRDYPELKFETGNMITYHPKDKMDLVTCVYDSINHILDMEDVKKVFQNVAEYLKEDGYFIFDFLHEDKIEEIPPTILEETDEGTIQFQLTKDQKKKILSLCFYKQKGEVILEKETIEERIYDREWILAALQEAGFTRIQMKKSLLDVSNMDNIEEKDGWIVIAQK